MQTGREPDRVGGANAAMIRHADTITGASRLKDGGSTNPDPAS
jgi:hypothetical protein